MLQLCWNICRNCQESILHKCITCRSLFTSQQISPAAHMCPIYLLGYSSACSWEPSGSGNRCDVDPFGIQTHYLTEVSVEGLPRFVSVQPCVAGISLLIMLFLQSSFHSVYLEMITSSCFNVIHYANLVGFAALA